MNKAFENLVVRLLLLIVAILRTPPNVPETREQKQDRDQLVNGRAIAFLNDAKRKSRPLHEWVGIENNLGVPKICKYCTVSKHPHGLNEKEPCLFRD